MQCHIDVAREVCTGRALQAHRLTFAFGSMSSLASSGSDPSGPRSQTRGRTIPARRVQAMAIALESSQSTTGCRETCSHAGVVRCYRRAERPGNNFLDGPAELSPRTFSQGPPGSLICLAHPSRPGPIPPFHSAPSWMEYVHHACSSSAPRACREKLAGACRARANEVGCRRIRQRSPARRAGNVRKKTRQGRGHSRDGQVSMAYRPGSEHGRGRFNPPRECRGLPAAARAAGASG